MCRVKFNYLVFFFFPPDNDLRSSVGHLAKKKIRSNPIGKKEEKEKYSSVLWRGDGQHCQRRLVIHCDCCCCFFFLPLYACMYVLAASIWAF